MRRLTLIFAVLIVTPLLALAETDPIPRLIDTDGPAQGVQPLELTELWRVGGDDDDDVIFGRIVDLTMHPNGNLYILDNQLCQVVVISPEGEHLTDLSRQGDGPGELRQPMALVFLEDDVLGVGMGFPGKIVAMTLDGTPRDSLFPVGEPAEGNIGIMMSTRLADGVLIASGGRLAFGGQGEAHTDRFLAVADEGRTGFTRILNAQTPLDPAGNQWVEAEAYFYDLRWDLGPGGTIYAPLKRDAYEVSVCDRTGKVLRVFGRDEKPRQRTQEEKDDVSPMIHINNNPANPQWDISDHDESITRIMYNHEDDTVWVLTPHGNNDQPEGILETWDVFSNTGEYLRRVPIPLGHEMQDGNCYLVGDSRLVVVKGTGSSFNGRRAPDEDEEAVIEPLEVICYQVR
jgi:hypothetical protein